MALQGREELQENQVSSEVGDFQETEDLQVQLALTDLRVPQALLEHRV